MSFQKVLLLQGIHKEKWIHDSTDREVTDGTNTFESYCIKVVCGFGVVLRDLEVDSI